MLLPFVGWAITGALFFIKPGYSGAYETLIVKTYPLDMPVTLPSNPAWLEARYLKTVLGEHLLVRTASGWTHLDPKTLEGKPAPSEADVRALLGEAFTANPERYGHIEHDFHIDVALAFENGVVAQIFKLCGFGFLTHVHYLYCSAPSSTVGRCGKSASRTFGLWRRTRSSILSACMPCETP